ncbi:MAG: response regulator [Verrucomicrobia bacterium]|nr:response regulator [Verrucomicrobiota bacterium]
MKAEFNSSSRRWLVVDDEFVIAELTAQLLRRLDRSVEVMSFDNPVEALCAFESEPESVEMVLTDCNMPELDGIELTRRIRSRGFGTKVVLMSANFPDLTTDEMRWLGFSATLAKPFSLDEIETALRSVLRPSSQPGSGMEARLQLQPTY